MEPTVLVEMIGITALGILCLVSAISSWQTRRFLITVFGENPRAAQLSQRGYYLRLPEQAPPVVAPPGSSGAAPGSSGARALAPTVQPAAVEPAPAVEPAAVEPAPATSPGPRESFKPSLAPAEQSARPAIRPPPLAREEPEPAPETKPKPGTAPSPRKRPAVTASTDLATLAARGLDKADQAQADQVPERRIPIEGPPHKPPHFVRKATILGDLPPSVAPPPMARPDSLPSAAPDDFDSDEEATQVMDLPTAEELALGKKRAHGRAITLVSASAGVPSSARPVPAVQVIGVDTPSKPGDKPAPVVVQ